MQVTIFSVAMTVLWSSLLIIIISVLRNSYKFLDMSGLPGILMLYIFCIVRMFVPIEFPWVKMVFAEPVYNRLVEFLYKEVDIGIFEPVKIEHFILVLWIGVSIILFVNLTVGYLEVNKTIQQLSYREDNRISEYLQIIEEKERGKVKAEIYKCYGIDIPRISGFAEKKILIPDVEYSDKQLYYIILHEYTHIRNKDQLNYLMVNMLCIVYWWNPFVYLLRNNLKFHLECYCDRVATRGMCNDEIAEYIGAITAVLQGKRKIKTIVPDNNSHGRSGISRKDIKERCRIIKESSGKKENGSGKIVLVMLTVVAFVISYSFAFHAKIMPARDDLLKSSGDIEVETDNSYILLNDDGTYELVSQDGSRLVISKEFAEKMMKDGFVVKGDAE